MPFFAKMSAHFRGSGYSAKQPQSKSIYTYGDKYYSSKHDHRLYANKEKMDDYDDNVYRNHNYGNFVCKSYKDERSGQIRKDNDNYVDWHYRKNKEKFASWDRKDLQNQRNSLEKEILNYDLGTKNSSEILDVEVEEIFVNGDSLSSSPKKRNDISYEKQCYGSLNRHRECTSSSLDRQNGKSRERKIVEPWSEDDDNDSLSIIFKEHVKPVQNNNNRDQSLRQIENFGSLKKKNDKNAGLNLGFRAIVDKFRTKSDNKEKNEIVQRNKRQEYVNENWQYDNSVSNDYKERNSPKILENNPPKDLKAEKNHQKDYDFDHEPNFRQFANKLEDYYHFKEKKHENNRSKRKSYALEASPENFDVRIQKYERVRHEDPDLHRRNSFPDRGSKNFDVSQKISSKNINGTSNIRKSSLRDKNKESLKRRESTKNRVLKSKISERHSRPLTPPMSQQVTAFESFQDKASKERIKDPSRKSFSMKEWYESNRQFAAKYLKEHSKIKELSTSDVSAKDEFIFGSPKECRTFLQNKNHDLESLYVDREPYEIDSNVDGYREITTVGQKESANIIKVRTNTEEDPMKRRNRKRAEKTKNGRRRRHRCKSVEYQDEKEEKDEKETISQRSEICERSFVMPTRKLWNYRDGV